MGFCRPRAWVYRPKKGVKGPEKKIHRYIKGMFLGQKRKERGVKDPRKRVHLYRIGKKKHSNGKRAPIKCTLIPGKMYRFKAGLLQVPTIRILARNFNKKNNELCLVITQGMLTLGDEPEKVRRTVLPESLIRVSMLT